MLTKKAFISGMNALKKGYIGWQFDLSDNVQVNFWYAALKNLSDEQFKTMITEYYAHNDQPPKCVKNLTDILVDKVYNQALIKPESALDHVRDVISNHGGWDYGGKKEIYAELKDFPALCETVKEFEGELRAMAANDTYTADRFRRAYEVRLRANAIKRVDTFLGLKLTDGTKLLGESALPYET